MGVLLEQFQRQRALPAITIGWSNGGTQVKPCCCDVRSLSLLLHQSSRREEALRREAAHRVDFDIGGGGWHDDQSFTPNRAEENATPCAWLPAER